MGKTKLTTTERSCGCVRVISLSGDLDRKSLPAVRTTLEHAAESDGARLLLDLDEVTFIDSSGLGYLIELLERLEKKGGNLKIARLNAYMTGIFKLLNLHEVLEVYDDIDEAVESFGGRTPSK